MFYPAILINLFFVPMLPLYLYYKSRRQPLVPSLELLFQYCIVVSLNHVTAHFITLLLLKLTSITTTLDSARYTLIVILAALLLFLAYIVIKYLKPEVSISRIEKNKEDTEHEEQTAP